LVNQKPAIATALSTDGELIALIPKTRMFSSVAAFSGTPIHPYLTFVEIMNMPEMFSDDEETESSITVRIDLWNTSSLSVIASHVDRIMKSIGFGRNWSIDNDEMLDDGTRIFHKSMSFSGTFTFVT